jgi:hypothetical protein
MTSIISRLVAFSVPYEIVDRRQRNDLPRLTKATREIGECRDQFLPVFWRPESEAVSSDEGMLAMSFAHIRIFNVSYCRDLDQPVLYANALMLVRKRDNLSAVAICDERGAMDAGVVLVEKSRQYVYRNVGRCTAQEVDTVEYRDAQRENGETCIGIY